MNVFNVICYFKQNEGSIYHAVFKYFYFTIFPFSVRCGQKKKLVINNGKGGIDEKKKDGLNGEASKSQEMVHLVHKEKPEDQKGPHDEFQAIDETQNQQDVPLKSGM